jgi:YegS/Rv2252/BmrU family lipid kinase
MTKKRILFIINPISGGKSKRKIESLLKSDWSDDEVEQIISYSEFPKHASELAKDKLSEVDLIIGVGGDGTINEIAQVLRSTNTPLGIIPMGSGNGLARHLKISLNPQKALKGLKEAKLSKVDTATLNGHFFVSIAGVGFDSIVAAEFSKSKGRGFIRYAQISIQKFFSYKEQDYALVIDGKSLERRAFMIVFANSNQFGYNTILAPNADCRDSYLDVCIVKKPKLFEIPKLLFQLWTGKADRSKHIETIRARTISLVQTENKYANIDGESVKVGQAIEVELKQGDLDILTP